MWFSSLLAKMKPIPSPALRPKQSRCRLTVEALEDRYLLSHTLVDLGPFTFSSVAALNSSGGIAGASGGQAVLWDAASGNESLGTLWPPPPFPFIPSPSSRALGLNDASQVVGDSSYWPSSLPVTHAFLWDSANGMRDLHTLANLSAWGNNASTATDINELGQVVGSAEVRNGYSSSQIYWSHAFRWDSTSGTTILGELASDTSSTAAAVNDAGQVVGSSGNVLVDYSTTAQFSVYRPDEAVLWSGGGAFGLGMLPGDTASVATGINDAGQVIGTSGSVLYNHQYQANQAFVWAGGTMTALGTLPGNTKSFANAINNQGQIVGQSGRAFLWENGVMTDLNALIDPALGWVLTEALDINDRGDIVGLGSSGGQSHYFLLSTQPISLLPFLSIDDVTVTEGDAGTTDAVFTVRLSQASAQEVAVSFSTADDRAVAGSDYLALSGTLTFSPGETSQTIAVPVIGDVVNEAGIFPTETFFVNLSNPTNAVIVDARGLGSITNDDVPPSLSINDVSVSEGQSGTVNAVFTVSRSGSSSQTATVNYATANGSAIVGSDYATASGTLTFASGETSQTITVSVNGDPLHEANEVFYLNLSGATNAVVADGQGQGTIVNDDVAPTLSINDVTIVEGNSGSKYAVFTVLLSAPSGKAVTVNFATANGTAKTGDKDYVATSGTLTFAPGETTKTITVQIKGDRKKEAAETFFVNLSGAVDALLGDSQGLGTILNDD